MCPKSTTGERHTHKAVSVPVPTRPGAFHKQLATSTPRATGHGDGNNTTDEQKGKDNNNPGTLQAALTARLAQVQFAEGRPLAAATLLRRNKHCSTKNMLSWL